MWGFPVASSAIVSWPVRAPVAVGEKATVSVHVAPAASEVPQLFDWTGNSATEVKLVTLIGRPFALVSVTVFAALVVPIACFANVSDPGVTPRLNVPDPLRFTLSVLEP